MVDYSGMQGGIFAVLLHPLASGWRQRVWIPATGLAHGTRNAVKLTLMRDTKQSQPTLMRILKIPSTEEKPMVAKPSRIPLPPLTDLGAADHEQIKPTHIAFAEQFADPPPS